MMSHKNGWWLIIGCSFRQFIAEQRIENGLLSVTQKILNPTNCLYTKESCDFLQSYEKSFKFQVSSFNFFRLFSLENTNKNKKSFRFRFRFRLFFVPLT